METQIPQDSDPIADSLGLTPVVEDKPALPAVEPPPVLEVARPAGGGDGGAVRPQRRELPAVREEARDQ